VEGLAGRDRGYRSVAAICLCRPRRRAAQALHDIRPPEHPGRHSDGSFGNGGWFGSVGRASIANAACRDSIYEFGCGAAEEFGIFLCLVLLAMFSPSCDPRACAGLCRGGHVRALCRRPALPSWSVLASVDQYVGQSANDVRAPRMTLRHLLLAVTRWCRLWAYGVA